MDDWFRFAARGRFRISPGPGWKWASVPRVADANPDRPVPGWPTAEYTAMRSSVNAALLRGGPTLNYADTLGRGQRSLVVKDVRVELPTRVDDSGTAVTAGSVVFETACFKPVRNGGPGGKLGDWLAWVEVSYQGGSAAVQLLTLDVVQVRSAGEWRGRTACEMSGGRLFVREGGHSGS